MRGRLVAGIFVAVFLVIACNALTGAGDLEATLGEEAGVGLGPDGSSGQASSGMTSGATSSSGMTSGGSTSSSGSSGTSSSSGSSGGVTCASAGGTCTPQAPDGFYGPYRVVDESTAKSFNGCPDTLKDDDFELFGGTPTGSFACPACKCQTPAGGSCAAVLTVFGDNTTCLAPEAGAPQTTNPASCFATTSTVSAKFTQVVTGSGKCDPGLNGQPQRGEVDWTTTYGFCGSKTLTAVGCDSANDRCLPPVDGAKICVLAEGKVACPAPWTVQTITYADTDDERSCDVSSCSCGAASGVSCKGSYASFSANTCTALVPIPPYQNTRQPDQCFVMEAGNSAKQLAVPTTQGGSCVVSGAPTSKGALLPKEEWTNCCLP